MTPDRPQGCNSASESGEFSERDWGQNPGGGVQGRALVGYLRTKFPSSRKTVAKYQHKLFLRFNAVTNFLQFY